MFFSYLTGRTVAETTVWSQLQSWFWFVLTWAVNQNRLCLPIVGSGEMSLWMPRHVLCRGEKNGHTWEMPGIWGVEWGGDFIMIGHRLVRKETGTTLNVIKSLRYIWPSGLLHLCQCVCFRHLIVAYRAKVCDKACGFCHPFSHLCFLMVWFSYFFF